MKLGNFKDHPLVVHNMVQFLILIMHKIVQLRNLLLLSIVKLNEVD